jgi:putative ABC transport system ATP-binding protein
MSDNHKEKEKAMSLLQATGVYKTYRAGSVETPALQGVDFAVEGGEFTAVVGPSGSGKTTLVNVLGGLDVPDRGQVFLDGQEISSLSSRQLSDLRLKKIGFIFQAYNLIPVLSALENVEYVMLLQGVPAKKRREVSIAVMEDLGLGDLINKRPNEMSGGQQQRVAVARAIVSEPRIVLADEPTANLDSATAEKLLELMRGMNEKKGITFIFSTHDPRVMETARRVATLKDGRIVEDTKK